MPSDPTQNHLKPAEQAEAVLIQAILAGRFSANTSLPAERELATQLGVTRPTLREVLQRLARDGWLEIRHGKPTRVKDPLTEGSLAILGVYAEILSQHPQLTAGVLELRSLLAPIIVQKAVENDSERSMLIAQAFQDAADDAVSFAQADWALVNHLAQLSGNPVFALIINGLNGIYQKVVAIEYANSEARQASKTGYRMVAKAARASEPEAAAAMMRRLIKQ